MLSTRTISKVLFDKAQQQRAAPKKCHSCGEVFTFKNDCNNICGPCVTRWVEKQLAVEEAKAKKLREHRKWKASREQFIVSVSSSNMKNGYRQKRWYGLFKTYEDVYKLIERVYPNPRYVPEEVQVDMREGREEEWLSPEQLEIDLRELKARKERAQEKKKEAAGHPLHARLELDRKNKNATREALRRLSKRQQRPL